MIDRADLTDYASAVRAVEPAARLVPRRVIRRAIRLMSDVDHDSVAHDRVRWVDRDRLFRVLTPAEFGLSQIEPDRLLLVAEPSDFDGRQVWVELWRTLFHAQVDRQFDQAIATGRIDRVVIERLPRQIGPAPWNMILRVLEEEQLVLSDDPPERVAREFVAFGLEVVHFQPTAWGVLFPGLRTDVEPWATLFSFTDSHQLFRQTRPGSAKLDDAHALSVERPAPRPVVPVSESDRPRIDSWVQRGNDLKAAVLLQRAGDPSAVQYLDRLIDRLQPVIGFGTGETEKWRDALRPRLPGAAARRWPNERRLLYELQRACLAVERPAYAADVVEWAYTLGRQPVKRPLPHTKWVEAHRRLRAAVHHAEQLCHAEDSAALVHLVEQAAATVEQKARNELRPEIVSVLDEVGLTPGSVAERISRDKLVEELLDAACGRGFLRIGDLRDAIARNRVKLPDLSGAREWLHGDALLRANRLLAVRLDGVYRRGEIYMRALQRGCSLLFGTRAGRLFTRFVALPVGGAYVLIEAVRHLIGAGKGLVNWLSGWTTTVKGLGSLAGGAAWTVADDPSLGHRGVTWPEMAVVTLVLFLLIHWPAFRVRVGQAAKFVFVRTPRAISKSEFVHTVFHNEATRLFRRYLLTPLLSGALAALGTWLVLRDWTSPAVVGGGVALFMGSFFRTPMGRSFEDLLDEAAQRFWRIVSVNFVLGLLTLVLQFFRAVFEAIDSTFYAVDESLRFREGQGRRAFVLKVAFGAVWFVIAYVFRFAWNLLVEPQINPIKHFPVVTVSHKLLLPLIPSLAKQFQLPEETMGTIVFGIPGIFGFLVWEFKENWKLYRANASPSIRPAIVGSHGEKMRALLRPGFHSGVVPKSFAKLRKAMRSGNRRRQAKYHHILHHVAEGVHRLVERSFIPHLERASGWHGKPIHAEFPLLTPNRVLIPLATDEKSERVLISLEERGGWVIASIAEAGWLTKLDVSQRAVLECAVTGFYKLAGVDAIREQMASVLGEQAYAFDAVAEGLVIPMPDGKDQFFDYDESPELIAQNRRLPLNTVIFSDHPLKWDAWVEWWEEDAAGKTPPAPVLPGWPGS
jgi:hypothetical protein